MNKLLPTLFLACAATMTSWADNAPFTVKPGLFDQSNYNTLGLTEAPGAETTTVFSPTSSSADKFANGVVMTEFRGALYCMWQRSNKDEDAADTYVAYSRSTDGGATWSEPMVLYADDQSGTGYCASGGWISTNDTLVAFINTRPQALRSTNAGYTRCIWSTDGVNWSTPKDVTMADGSQMNGIIEQDPHRLTDGRIVGAAHFQPGLVICPIYTDDPTGQRGWHKGQFSATKSGSQSRELEPSLFVKSNGTIVMTFRDQNSTDRVLAAQSTDRGQTWTKAVQTDMPDCRSKQSAGNLPDGTAFIVNCPNTNKRTSSDFNNKPRLPLAITMSADGNEFDRAYMLRSGAELQAVRYSGQAKRKGFHYPKSMVAGDYLYVAYATNKEDVQYTRVPLSSLQLNTNGISRTETNAADGTTTAVYNLSGTLVNTHAGLSGLPAGVYVVKTTTGVKVKTTKVVVR